MSDKKDLYDKYETLVEDVEESVDEVALTDNKEQAETKGDYKFNFELFEDNEKSAEEGNSEIKRKKEPKKSKTPKEKKAKEPKPVKEKVEKKPKKPKEKKAKKDKAEAEEVAFAEQLTKKDHLTFALVIFTLILAIAFVCVKFIFVGSEEPKIKEPETKIENISAIRTDIEKVDVQYTQSDIKNVFYSWSGEEIKYYQYSDNKMKPLSTVGSITSKVEMGEEELSVIIDYVQQGEELFGIGRLDPDQELKNSAYSKAVFKLTNLPKGYEQDGKILLLATIETGDAFGQYSRWTDSFIVEIETGKATRFLSNTKTDLEEAAGFSVLTNEAYMTSDGKIPFFTTREYDKLSGKRDIYIKDGTKEYAFAEDVYGYYVIVDGDAVIYLKSTEAGFDVVKKVGDDEIVVFGLKGDLNTNYLYHNEYLFDKENGNIYNVKSGTKTQVADYKMLNPESISVSDDGKHLVIMGTVKNVVDYQVHIVNLETGSCAKYEDTNFSKHTNIMFIDDKFVMYIATSPEKGYENVIFDITKINKK